MADRLQAGSIVGELLAVATNHGWIESWQTSSHMHHVTYEPGIRYSNGSTVSVLTF